MTVKKILAVLAHPDDETLGFGGTLLHYADKGVQTHLICATRGQRGWFESPETYPGEEALGKIREKELASAAKILQLDSVLLLDYMDGELDTADPKTVIHQLADQIRQIRPQIVLTFDPYGVYGHPDHIAISQFTTAAIVQAADASHENGARPHRVDALYYRVMSHGELEAYQSAFGDLVMLIDGVQRRATPWEEWAISARLDTRAYVPRIWEAVRAHQSQIAGYTHLLTLSLDKQEAIFGSQSFYRVFNFATVHRQQAAELFTDVGE
jgi:LmbE family N-acetylglucosaminyl deacetylase